MSKRSFVGALSHFASHSTGYIKKPKPLNNLSSGFGKTTNLKSDAD
jgi:hypothetical protein